MKNFVIALLLILASIHCACSIFSDNTSYLNLRQYAQGTERMPFQARFGMMPVLRLAHTGAFAHILQDFTNQHNGVVVEPSSPERNASELAGIACVLAMVGALSLWGRRFLQRAWWLPASLLLAMLYANYAARYEQAVWYPYDLPHFLLFGLAFLALIVRKWALLLLYFICDCCMRETAIFLLPCVLALLLTEHRRRPVLLTASAMLVAWAAIYFGATHAFQHNPSVTGIRYRQNYQTLLNPWHWAQLASAGGFLLVPLFLARRALPRPEQYILLATLPGIFIAALFGIWVESRIWAEWCMPLAILWTQVAARTWLRAPAQQTPSPSQPANVTNI
jgi:hypothetical protein